MNPFTYMHILVALLIIAFAHWVHKKWPKQKEYVDPFAPIPTTATYMEQIYDVTDAIDMATTLRGLDYAEEMIVTFSQNNKHIPGYLDDIEDMKKEVSRKRNKILSTGLRPVK